MSPEVLLGKPYGKPSDVFSFGVLLWEMLHFKYAVSNWYTCKFSTSNLAGLTSFLCKFYHFDRRDYVDVIVRRGYRPSIDGSLPIMIKTIIKESWDEDPSKRPTFDRIAVLLKAEYQAMASGEMLDHSEKLIDKSARSFRTRPRQHTGYAGERTNEAIDIHETA